MGEHCWRCGQPAVDLHRPLRELAGNFFEDVLSLDTRLLRSIGPLLRRPGFLTREHLAGRRVRYATPLRLFLLATLLFAGLSVLLPRRPEFRILTEPERANPAAPRQGEAPRTVLLPRRLTRFGDAAMRRRMAEASEKAKANPREFMKAMAANLPRAFFLLLLPFFALLLRLFFWRQDRFYLDHLVFALHFHAFGFVVLSLNAVAVRLWDPVSRSLLILLWCWLFVYLAIALRRVYGGSRPWTAVKLLGLLGLYTMAMLLAVTAMIPITLYLL